MNARITIGSSDVAALLGLARPGASRADSPWRVWQRLMLPAPSEGTAAMRAGHIVEPALRGWYAREYAPEADVRRGPTLDEEPIYGPESWMAARPDGLVPGDRVLELKKVRIFDEGDGWGPDESDQVPGAYAAQCLWQMVCADLRRADLVAWSSFSDEIRVYHLADDPEIAAAVMDVCRTWYRRHVVDGERPDPDASAECSAVLARLWTPGPECREATSDERVLLAEWAEARAERKAAEARADELAARVKSAIGESYGLTIGGRKAAVYSPTKSSTYTVTRAAGRTLRPYDLTEEP